MLSEIRTSLSESQYSLYELKRIDALNGTGLARAPADIDLDLILSTLLATLDFPIGFIALVDEDVLRFKSRIGLDLTETPRATSFCTHAIRNEGPLVVENALRDDRYSRLPLVTGTPHLVTYVGVPIRSSSGFRIATLCVADTQPRHVSEVQTATLCRFAGLVERLVAGIEQSGRSAEDLHLIHRIRSEQARLQLQVARIEERIAVGHWELDLVTRKVAWSRGISELHGLDHLAAQQPGSVLSLYSAAERERISTNLRIAEELGYPFDFVTSLVDADGVAHRIRISGERVVPEIGNTRLVGIVQDITDLHETRSRLDEALENDPVTQVRNSQAFEKSLAEWTGDNGPGRFALVTIGVPEIMGVRQSFGMFLTDMMLREMANVLRSQLKDGEVLARISPEAFSFLTHAALDPGELSNRVGNVLKLLNRNVTVLRNRIDIEPQGSVAMFPADGATPLDLMLAADLAFRAVGDMADSAIAFFDQSMLDRFAARENASQLLRSAIAEARVLPFYQPIVRLSDGVVTSFEALARVNMPDGSVLGPAGFWSALLHPHIAREVGFIICDAVIAQLAAWQAAGLDLPTISVNATASDLSEGGMCTSLLQALEARNISPTCLKVEVTENVLLGQGDCRIGQEISALRAQGLSISLDDFGTGHASLTNLLSLPVDEVKVDRSFVNGLADDADSRAITSSILSLARKMEISTVSEGIETAEQLAFVRDNGSTHGQGFLLGHPMSAEEATALGGIGRIDVESLMGSRQAV